MHQVYSLTEAKAKFSEIINHIIFQKETFLITKKGKAVAAVIPIDDLPGLEENNGLIRAMGALEVEDSVIEGMVDEIYASRIAETDRKVDL